MFYRDERLALFIDGSNLYAAAKALNFDIDYRLLRTEFMRRGKMLRAFYYTALLEGEDYSPLRPLVDWLNYNGYTMVTKGCRGIRGFPRAAQDKRQYGYRAGRASDGAGRPY